MQEHKIMGKQTVGLIVVVLASSQRACMYWRDAWWAKTARNCGEYSGVYLVKPAHDHKLCVTD